MTNGTPNGVRMFGAEFEPPEDGTLPELYAWRRQDVERLVERTRRGYRQIAAIPPTTGLFELIEPGPRERLVREYRSSQMHEFRGCRIGEMKDLLIRANALLNEREEHLRKALFEVPGQTLDYDTELDVRFAGAEKLEELALTAPKDNDTALARSVLAVAMSFDQAPEVAEMLIAAEPDLEPLVAEYVLGREVYDLAWENKGATVRALVPEVPPPFALSDLSNETTKATQEAPDERKPETPGS